MQRSTRAPPRLRRRLGRLERGRLLDHDRHVVARHHRIDRDRHRAAHPRSTGGRKWIPGASATAPIRRSGRRDALRPGAARHRPARPGRGRARAGGDSQSGQSRSCSAPTAGRSPTTATYQQALDVLNRAHTQDQPDWRILSVQGAVLDQMGRHADAQRHYASALRLMPDEPSVLSNLGLSYALSKNLQEAEATLRAPRPSVGAEPKVRQNLALVVGLQGRFQEAETIAQAAIFRRARPPPTSPTCGRCWRSRAIGKKASAARRWCRRRGHRLSASVISVLASVGRNDSDCAAITRPSPLGGGRSCVRPVKRTGLSVP